MNRLISLIAVVLVLLIGGYLIYNAITGAPDRPSPTPTPTANNNTPVPNSPSEVPADWETYTSEEMNFFISHPTEMEVNQPTGIEGVRFLLIGPTQTQGTEMFDGISMTINVDTYSADTLREFVELERQNTINEPTNPQVAELEEVSIAGKSGYQFEVSSLGDFTHIYLPIEGNRYAHIIYLLEDPQNQGYQETLDTIMSSLNFL